MKNDTPEDDELAAEARALRVQRRCDGIAPRKRRDLHGAKVLVVLRTRHAVIERSVRFARLVLQLFAALAHARSEILRIANEDARQ